MSSNFDVSRKLDALENRIGHRFSDPRLLHESLRHPSCSVFQASGEMNNQRLEFLGDAVLQTILSEALLRMFPKAREGELTKMRSLLVRRSFLKERALHLGLGEYLSLLPSEDRDQFLTRTDALGDAIEALAGAVFLDAGFEKAQTIILSWFPGLRELLTSSLDWENPKGRLQEKLHPIHGNDAIRYEVINREGVDHAPVFEARVLLQESELGRGTGKSKKEAEEQAATAALRRLASEPS